MVKAENSSSARLVHTKGCFGDNDSFRKFQKAIVDRFSDLRLDASSIQIFWMGKDGLEVVIEDSDDLSAMYSVDDGICKLHIRRRKEGVKGIPTYIPIYGLNGFLEITCKDQ